MMLKVIIAATGLVLGAAGANACEYSKSNTTAQSPVPAVTAQAPQSTLPAQPAPQDVAQAEIAKPATNTKTN
jgi:hypothetical protein